jgi:hypothetical protein
VEQINLLFTILNLSCSGGKENGLSNRSLISILSAILIGLEHTLERLRQTAYYLNTSMMQNRVRNNAKMTRSSFCGATITNLQQSWKLVNLCFREATRLLSNYDCSHPSAHTADSESADAPKLNGNIWGRHGDRQLNHAFITYTGDQFTCGVRRTPSVPGEDALTHHIPSSSSILSDNAAEQYF